MINRIFNWSLCLAVGGLMTVSCQKDVGQVEVSEEAVGQAERNNSAYANDPRTNACRIVLPNETVKPRGAAYNYALWKPGQTITVSFMGGSEYVRQKVMQYAVLWEEYANIKFQLVESNGMIRIAFIPGEGSYSYYGTDAFLIPANVETMNYGGFNDNTSDVDFRAFTLHEFGHALGFVHEHQHPDVELNWDREFTYDYYAAYPNNWDRETVDFNLFDTIDSASLTYNAYDVHSIMHYQIVGQMINSDTDTPNNTELSAGDKELAGILYPF